MLVGFTRIWATPKYFVDQFKDIERFESGPGMTTGVFSRPAVLEDLNRFALSAQDVAELRECKPGKCAFKLGDSAIQALAGQVNWSASDSQEQATKAFHSTWLQYLRQYQEQGNAGLAVYHDNTAYFHVADGLAELMARSPALRVRLPEVDRYLRDYPRTKGSETEEFFYWQVAAFGLKPVHRVTHVAIQKSPEPWGDRYVIASKMLMASHYFGSALELRILIPGQDQRIGGMHYLIVVQRSLVDGLTGMKGAILRRIVSRKSSSAMKQYLQGVKAKVEAGFNHPR